MLIKIKVYLCTFLLQTLHKHAKQIKKRSNKHSQVKLIQNLLCDFL